MIWYIADLLPGARGMFGHGFYPEPKRGTHAEVVFFAILDEPQQRVLVCSRLEGNWIRIVTAEVAQHIIKPRIDIKYGIQKVNQTDTALLNLKAVNITNKFI